MKEELIRIEHGYFHSESGQYQFDVSIAHGECIGVYVDEHLTSGTAYLDIFKGKTVFTDGRAFCCGQRIGATGLERWIRQNAIVVDKSRFASKELTMRDFVLALVRTNHLRQRFPSTERLTSLAATDMLHRMGLNLPCSTRLIDLSMLDYYRLSIFRAWFNGYKLLVLDRLTETLRRQDLAKLMDCVQLLLRHGTAVFLFDMDEAFMFRYARLMRSCQQAEVVGCRHFHCDTVFQFLGCFLLGATSLVAFLVFLCLFHILFLLIRLLIQLYRPTGCHLLQFGWWVASGFGTPETQTCYLPILKE